MSGLGEPSLHRAEGVNQDGCGKTEAQWGAEEGTVASVGEYGLGMSDHTVT